MHASVTAEIVALHAEYERWFRGASDDCARIEASLAEDFSFVSPQGDRVPPAELRENLRGGRGARPDIRIRIEKVVSFLEGETAIATYEEWHTHADYETTRQCTAVLIRHPSAPGGWLWRHVHETWKLPPPKRR